MLNGLYKKFYPAFCGLKDLITTEKSVRIQLGLAVCALSGGYLLGFDYMELIVVAVLSTIVISLECCNTLFEWLMDANYQEYHTVAKRLKDGAAGMVLVASIMSFVIGICMVLRHVR